MIGRATSRFAASPSPTARPTCSTSRPRGRAGEFLVLLGPSGCGKSTLLNAIAGLPEVDDGEIWIGGRNVTWLEPKDRGIAMVFQSYALYPRMNVRAQPLLRSAGLRGTPRAEIERRVARGGRDAADRRPARSPAGGALGRPAPARRNRPRVGARRRRVSVRRAAVESRRPAAQPNCASRSSVCISGWAATMIYVTHDQIEALTLADRIAVMKDRTFQQIGTPQEIYLRPVNRFVADLRGLAGDELRARPYRGRRRACVSLGFASAAGAGLQVRACAGRWGAGGTRHPARAYRPGA